MMLRLQIYKYRCADGQHDYKAAGMPSGAYGEFLMRSEGRRAEAYLNAIQDPVYEEVDQIIKTHPRLKGKDAFQLANILRAIFGVACDSDVDGTLFRIGLRPRCPVC